MGAVTPRAWLALGALVALATAASPSTASEAEDVEQARRLFVEGSRLGQKGSWPEARDRFRSSLALKRAPLTLYSLGVAERECGAKVAALETLRAFLAEPGTPATASYQQAAKKAVDELDVEVGRVRVTFAVPAPPGTVVEIDGRAIDAASLAAPVLVDPGPHEVRAAAPSLGELRVDVLVAAASSQAVTLRIVGPSSPARSATLPPPAPAPLVPRAVPWALAAGGVTAIAAGVAIGLVGVSQARGATTRDGSEADAARTKALVGDVVAGVGVAAVAAGAGLWLLGPRLARAPHARIAPYVAGPGCGVAGTF
jgi:hypothetical protein